MSTTLRHDRAHRALNSIAPQEQAESPNLPARRLYLLGLAFFAAAAIALSIDVPTAGVFRSPQRLPGDLRKMVNVFEAFGFGGGAAMICLSVWTLDPTRRPKMPRLLACVYGAGAGANIVKCLIARTRPYAFDFQSGVFGTFKAALGGVDSAAHGAAIEAFPSGHTATAVALAIALGWLYPKGRPLFAFFAVMTAVQRISSSAHYVSDTLCGAAIATLVCGLCFDPHVFCNGFCWLEARISGKYKKIGKRNVRELDRVLN